MRTVTVDLFSGLGGFAVASHMMGWETLVLCEIDDNCKVVLAHHFPDAYIHGDIHTLTGEIINEEIKKRYGDESVKVVLCGGFPCFVAGTLIRTIDGMKNIEDIKIGDSVLTHDGEYGTVNAVMQKSDAPTWLVKAHGIPKPLETTVEHPFYVRRKKFPKARKYESRWGAPEWVAVSEIRPGDKVGYRVREGTLEYENEDFWFLVGRYLADGHVSNGYVHIDANEQKLPALKALVERIGFHHTVNNGRTCIRLSIRNSAFLDFVEGFGKYAYGKKLSGMCFELKSNLKMALFNGWAEGDGYDDGQGGKRVTTVSKELAFCMAQIARDSFKTAVSMNHCTPSRAECIIEGRKVNERPFYRVIQPNSNREARYKDGFIWSNVTTVEKSGNFKTVYNIGVHGQETYTADGVTVHNCQPYSAAGKRLGKEDARHLWPEMLRVIQECRPDAIVGENVSGIVSWDGGLVFEEVQTDLEAEGYEVQAVVVPACSVGAPHRRDRVWFVANAGSTGGLRQNGRNPNNHSQRLRSESELGRITVSNGIEGFGEPFTGIEPPPHARLPESQGRDEVEEGQKHGGWRLAWSQLASFGGAWPFAYAEETKFKWSRDSWGWRHGFANDSIYGNGDAPNTNGKRLRRQSDGQGNARQFGEAGAGSHWQNFPTEPPLRVGDDGISARLGRVCLPGTKRKLTESAVNKMGLKMAGNAVVPQVVFQIFKALEATW